MFRIVFVCTGNRCRSPFAEVYMRALLEGLPVEVESVGTLEIEGGGVPAPLVELARAAGYDVSAHRARTITRADPDAIDLCIGLAREHAAAAVVNGGFARERTFTLAEIARLAERIDPPDENDPVARARGVVEMADALRANEPNFVPAEDVDDPMGGPRAAYQTMVERVIELCDRLASALFGVNPRANAAKESLDLQVK